MDGAPPSRAASDDMTDKQRERFVGKMNAMRATAEARFDRLLQERHEIDFGQLCNRVTGKTAAAEITRDMEEAMAVPKGEDGLSDAQRSFLNGEQAEDQG